MENTVLQFIFSNRFFIKCERLAEFVLNIEYEQTMKLMSSIISFSRYLQCSPCRTFNEFVGQRPSFAHISATIFKCPTEWSLKHLMIKVKHFSTRRKLLLPNFWSDARRPLPSDRVHLGALEQTFESKKYRAVKVLLTEMN